MTESTIVFVLMSAKCARFLDARSLCDKFEPYESKSKPKKKNDILKVVLRKVLGIINFFIIMGFRLHLILSHGFTYQNQSFGPHSANLISESGCFHIILASECAAFSSWREKKIMKAQRQHISVNKCGDPFSFGHWKNKHKCTVHQIATDPFCLSHAVVAVLFGWYHCFGILCSAARQQLIPTACVR